MKVAVAGGKGGVGTSTVAYNLGAALEGVVVDADLGMADLPPSRGPDLHDVLAGRADPVEAVREDGPVALLPCGRTLAGARAADLRALGGVLDAVERAYGRVVVDCPSGLGGDVGLALLAADRCVLVTTTEAPALGDALRVRALARELGTGLSRVVVNRCEERPTDGIREAFGAPVVAVPSSGPLARAMANGVPVSVTAPDAVAARRFDALAAALRGR